MSESSDALAARDKTPPVITTPAEYRQSLQSWQSRGYHVLSPIADFSGLAAQHGLIATRTYIDPDPDHEEVYVDPLFCGADEIALAKNGLSKIALGLGVSITTERTDPHTIRNYWAMKARATFIGIDGRPTERDAHAEFDLRDSEAPRVAKMESAARRAKRDPTAQLAGARMFGLRNAEARAINAVIRLFGLRQTYTKAELSRPFVAVRVMWLPDPDDPEQRRMVAERALAGTSSLYASHRPTVGSSTIIDVNPQEASPVSTGSASTAGSAAPSPKAKVDPDQPPTKEAVRIASIAARSGEKHGRKWTRWSITDSHGVEHSTFDAAIAEAAEKAKAERRWVELIENVDGQYRNLVEIAAPQPALDGLDVNEL